MTSNDKKPQYGLFYQIHNDLASILKTPYEFAVLCKLIQHSNEDGEYFPSQELLAQGIMSTKQVSRACKSLERKEYITIERHPTARKLNLSYRINFSKIYDDIEHQTVSPPIVQNASIAQNGTVAQNGTSGDSASDKIATVKVPTTYPLPTPDLPVDAGAMRSHNGCITVAKQLDNGLSPDCQSTDSKEHQTVSPPTPDCQSTDVPIGRPTVRVTTSIRNHINITKSIKSITLILLYFL